MGTGSVHEHLRRACEELDAACDAPAAADAEEYLTDIARLLEYHVDGDVTDPEAHAYPPPGALDTIQNRLSELVEETDDPAAEHLQNARTRLLAVIVALDDRLNEGRPLER